jgi:steroid 5-alpha reductase family enzyme
MFSWSVYLSGLAMLCAAGTLVWLVSLVKRDVSIVDSLWPVFFIIAGAVYYALSLPASDRATLVLVLVSLWAVRLGTYITWRNWGDEEDRRYQKIRANNQPHFGLKSLVIVFLLQAAIAWVVSLPLLGAMRGASALGLLDLAGAALILTGLYFEAVGDWQLARFKADPDNRGKVMSSGLWRYTRHPNYFGDFCVWWGFYVIAVSAGAWWALPGPVVMTVFLLKVSGVALLEKDIGERRPKYRDYIERTNAFFPGPPRAPKRAD